MVHFFYFDLLLVASIPNNLTQTHAEGIVKQADPPPSILSYIYMYGIYYTQIIPCDVNITR